jgi:mono/diheme cytochrome c family protein
VRLLTKRVGRLTAMAAALAAAAVVAGGAALVAVERRLDRAYPIEAAWIEIPESPAALVRGRHLVRSIAQCMTCHGDDLSGRPMADDFWLGRLFAPNLTPGEGGIHEYSTGDFVRSIRHGVGPDARPLLVMPAQYLFQLSDADLGAIIAYLRTLPAVDRATPGRRLGPASVMALLAGRVPELIPAELLAERPPRMRALAATETADYGLYLIEVSGCKVCHRDDLSGGLHPLSLPGEPPPPDLRASGPLSTWSERDFVVALRTGVTPDGRQLDDAWMPWKTLSRMNDLELRAIWRGLRSLPKLSRSATRRLLHPRSGMRSLWGK